MIRRDFFTAIGGFDPQYSLAEDYDFLLKAANNASVDYIDEPLLLYREHGESGTYKKIDQITREAVSILHVWKSRNPWLFRKHFFKCLIFWVNSKC